MKEKRINKIGILVIALTFAVAWFWMDMKSFADARLNLPETNYLYTIEPGMNLTRIARELEANQIISSAQKLKLLAKLQGSANHIRLGEYELAQSDTIQSFLDKIVRGEVKQYSLTLVEGWNFHQVMDAIHNDTVLTHSLKGLSAKQIMAKLGYPEQHPEGRFFPDTYHFPRGMSDLSILKQAYEKMAQTLKAEWPKRLGALPYETPYDALIMASIVEKETAVPSERTAIAGVFVRRLEVGMRLQTDPTIIYGLGQSFDGNLRKKHLQDSSNPYNTYRIKGMPPTPIAMPGVEAIRAALNPMPGEALYFVSKGDGSHYFSATLDEHNRAVVRYQLKGRKRAFSSMKKDGTAIKDK
ncbi:MAG: endolytic transglycosylase MltG [Gammaproteobacteria bacterium]|nr:endolytic transglycosylase MltG [Gammaproteobacteria bacterium]